MTPAQEEWRPVVGYEALYEVSNLGRVRSLDRVTGGGGSTGRIGRRTCRGKVLSAYVDRRDGRRQVSLCIDGHCKARRVYRLVLEAFVGPCPPGMEGCHRDGNPANDRLDNLRWDTSSENELDKVRHGNHHNARKTRCKHGHLLQPPNLLPGPRRMCLACARGRNTVRAARDRGIQLDLQAAADEHYAKIMKGTEVP